jgi:hypothetical protein
MPTIDYEALRKRHAETRPLRYLTGEELAALEQASGFLRELAFLARCERGDRMSGVSEQETA